MRNKTGKISAIILAAGSSSRMGAGRFKLLLPLGGRPVLAHVLEATLASEIDSVLLVLGHRAQEVQDALQQYLGNPRLQIVLNHDYTTGMGSSLHTGIAVIMARPDWRETVQGAMVILGDQPLLTTQIIDTLITARERSGQRIIAPMYQGKRGTPVLFEQSLFPELLQVQGDEGGRSVIERHRHELYNVEVGSNEASYDVDTWDAYQRVVQEWQSQQQ